MKESRFHFGPTAHIPAPSNAEQRLLSSESLTRQAMGLESAATVSATFGNFSAFAGSSYLRLLAEIMKRFPRHFHLFAGDGEIRSIRGYLHAEGVLPRIRFLGAMTDVLPLFGVLDLYLAPFPDSTGRFVLESMAAGKPVVILSSSGDDLVGIRELVAMREPEYVEIADRLIRNPDISVEYGLNVRNKFKEQCDPRRVAERCLEFVHQVVEVSGGNT
jgi:hypothetical protein